MHDNICSLLPRPLEHCTSALSDPVTTKPVSDLNSQGNAKILNANVGDSLQQATHISNQQYVNALVIFFVGYSLFNVPSIVMLKKAYPSRWFSFIMLGWGSLTMIEGTVNNFGGLAGVRFLLGAFEAGVRAFVSEI
jgi:hypothetical protein